MSKTEMEHVRWPHIGQLHDAVFFLRSSPAASLPARIMYRAKAKLHGTNAAVQIRPDGSVGAQSRSRMITPQDDNQGFASWVHAKSDDWSSLRQDNTVVVFGEWSGPGIQKGTSCNHVAEKFFAVFAVQVGAEVLVEPGNILSIISGLGCHVIPWHCQQELVAGSPQDANAFADYVSDVTGYFADRDPWISSTFDVHGPGEDLVWYPGFPAIRGTCWSDLLFKSKHPGFDNAKHAAKAARATPQPFDGAADFVFRYVTPGRCEQALTEGCDGVWTMQTIGPFLRWISQDICRESTTDLAASGVEWKAVAKLVQSAAKDWFLNGRP